MTRPENPQLSAILIVGNERFRAANALQSVYRQDIIDQIEILVVDVGDPDQPDVEGLDHPCVTVHKFGPGLPSGEVRARAIQVASAPIVTFIEEHAEALPGWASACVKAHENAAYAAVGPEFHIGNTGYGLSDVCGLAYYPRWINPAERGEYDSLPLHDTSYKRERLLAYGDQLATLLFPEILLQWQLRRDGYKLFLEPDMKIAHYFETDLSVILRGNFLASRAFLHKRPTLLNWPWWKRIGRFMLSPTIPVLRTWRTGRAIATYRPDRLGYFYRNLVYFVLIYAANAAGEMIGMITGPGQSEMNYLHYQVSDPRIMPDKTL